MLLLPPGVAPSSVTRLSVQVLDRPGVLLRVLGSSVQLAPDPVALTAAVPSHGTEQGAAEDAALALSELARAGITVDDFSLGQPSLDEVFLALTASDLPHGSARTTTEGITTTTTANTTAKESAA